MTRVVKLVFLDDDPSKRALCDEANRTARILKIPRAMLAGSAERKELDQVGLYLLIGENSDEPDRPFVYVGETENLMERLSGHTSTFTKFDWHTALVLVAQDESLNKAHVKYLEHEWYQIMVAANVASVDQNVPSRARLAEAEEAIANDFSKTGRFLIEALGFRVFEKRALVTQTAGIREDVPRFVFLTSQAQGNRSYGRPTEDGFLVEQGSCLDPELKKAGVKYWGPVRARLAQENVIGTLNGKLVFLKEWLAPSPSRAAAVAYGGSVNGLEYWRTEATGETLRSWQAKNAIT